MNERIKELAVEAKAFIVEPEHASVGGVSEVSFNKYSDLEKFAELILGECLDILDGEDDHGYTAKRVRIAAYRIKERFGVEE